VSIAGESPPMGNAWTARPVEARKTVKTRVVLPISVLVLAWMAFTGCHQWATAHWWIVNGPDNQSEFFKTYNPQPVYTPFQHDGCSVGHGEGSSPGYRSIRHYAEFTPGFTMRVDRKQELLDALRNDILLRFRNTDTKIVASDNEADGGFTYKYVSGHSIGSISVQPPVHDEVQRVTSLEALFGPGLDDLRFKVALKETWTRPANETPWWMKLMHDDYDSIAIRGDSH
jgi:hypothetical protein